MNKYYFIHNNDFIFISGGYKNFPEIKKNLGTTLADYKNGKYVLLNKEQVEFLQNNPSVTPEEAFKLKLNKEVSIVNINNLIAKINDYDTSDNVNVFYVNDTPTWLSNDARISIGNKLTIEKNAGKTTTVLWLNNIAYTLDIDRAQQMLSDIELYAIECYNNTRNNITKAKALKLKSEVDSFDITQGYPEKLRFNI